MEKITYHTEGDYQIPDLNLPKQEKINLGKYARMRLNYLKNNNKGLYTELMIKGELTNHLLEVENQAQKRLDQIIQQLAKKNKVNEEMKEKDQMKWVGLMNNFKTTAEEIIAQEIIYN